MDLAFVPILAGVGAYVAKFKGQNGAFNMASVVLWSWRLLRFGVLLHHQAIPCS